MTYVRHIFLRIDIVYDGKKDGRGVDAKSYPPNQLFVEFLFKIFQDNQSNG